MQYKCSLPYPKSSYKSHVYMENRYYKSNFLGLLKSLPYPQVFLKVFGDYTKFCLDKEFVDGRHLLTDVKH